MHQTKTCLPLSFPSKHRAQVDALHSIYVPVNVNETLIYPRFDPGAENDTQLCVKVSADYQGLTATSIWLAQLRLMDEVNPGGVSTFNGNLSVYRERGGKFLTFHGRMDPLIASGNSKRYYLVAKTLGPGMTSTVLIPAMSHCADGPGAYKFGQPQSVQRTMHNIIFFWLLSIGSRVGLRQTPLWGRLITVAPEWPLWLSIDREPAQVLIRFTIGGVAVIDFAVVVLLSIVLASRTNHSAEWYRIALLIIAFLAGLAATYNCWRSLRIHKLQTQVQAAAAHQLPSYYAHTAPPGAAPIR
ncbi:Carboxylic ester hydrolase [Mycena indigotica]|uniref:Carboxylic ester hydrolase n=1 Tax=Mycena indigotica TaxID=2126181 RepID=A0A8H6S0K2_9AGAR|nr:Carboxylic ester hydrolase [Mycena indigotica]KAF7289826.1 Carboxylic ester hydrolase [Mycena indigotica]